MADDGRNADIRVERRDDDEGRTGHVPPEMDVRDEDLEPHAGLRYIARMFKILAILLILLPVAAEEAHALAGAAGGLAGLLIGFPLARLRED